MFKRLNSLVFENKPLHYKLSVIFCFFFFIPVAVLLFFGVRYDLLSDGHLSLFLMVLLGVSFLGLTMLRKVFDNISGFSEELYLRLRRDFPDRAGALQGRDELHRLALSMNLIDAQLKEFTDQLDQKKNELKILKGMADLCYVTADPDEILHVTLERALALTGSDVGSIMLLAQGGREFFEVRAAIGLDPGVKLRDKISFDSSIAKYAVLNKAALVVEDVEKDPRFGRPNLSHYATKSFVCLPIKTSREIIGVLTLSSRSHDMIFQVESLAALEPLLSNAAFTYENLVMAREDAWKSKQMNAIAAMLEITSSSFHGVEMLQVCLNEVRNLVPADLLLLFKFDPARTDQMTLLEFLSSEPTLLARDQHFPIPEGSTLDKVLRQQSTIDLPAAAVLADEHHLDLLPQQKAYMATAVTLKMQGAISGLLILLRRDQTNLGPRQRFLEWTARCLALAIERNRLYEAVARRNRELESIKQIGSALASSTFDIKQVLNYTMDMIRLIMDVETGALYLVEDNALVFAVSFNADSRKRHPVKLRLGQGIPGYVAARGESMMINESHGTALFMPAMKGNKDFPIRSALCVPMISQGRVIGVIEVLNKNDGDFVPGDQDLLQSIASSVSIAIENANLYKETVAMAENERGIRRIFQKFVPKAVLEKILHGSSGSLEMAEELKTLTLLNIDIRGFSGLVKTLGPQKSVALLNAFFSSMGGIVFKHHGIVDKYLGDGFLAIFGAPVSSVADADNAVAAALEMQQSLDKMNANLYREMNTCLKIGISIHTGEVVVGNIGFEMKMDYTVIGDAVNDVFRLQDMLRPFPNGILLSENTLRATRVPVKYLELDQRLGQSKIYELRGFSQMG